MFTFSISREAFVFEFVIAEIDQQPDFDPGGVKIINDLRLMFGRDRFDSLQFDSHLFLNEYIYIKITDAFTPEYYLNRMLGCR